MNKVDGYVGSKIRQLRLERGVTQQQLAEMIGVRFQQVQKYESGYNRVSASRLFAIAEALGCAVSYFFEGAQDVEAAPKTATETGVRVAKSDSLVRELVAAFDTLPKERKLAVLRLVQTLREDHKIGNDKERV